MTEAEGLVTTARRLGQDVLGWVGPMIAATAAILLVVWLADRALERRVSASVRLFLYGAVLARLALPVDWHSPLGLLGLGSGRGGGGQVSLDGGMIVAPLGSAQGTLVLGAAGWAALLYAAVVLVLLGRWVQVRWRLQRRLRECQPVRVAGTDGVAVLRHEVLGPFVTGLLRSRIVIPGKLLDGPEGPEGGDAGQAGRDALGWVLRHELAHVRRRDPVASALVQVACILAWPILPVWIAARRIRALMEVACDESAVTGADRSARRRYGEVLLLLAEASPSTGLTPALRFGSPLRGRLRALAASRRWPLAVQGAVVAALVTVVVACAGEPPPEELASTDAAPESAALSARPPRNPEGLYGLKGPAPGAFRDVPASGPQFRLLGEKLRLEGSEPTFTPAAAASPSPVTGEAIPGAASVRGSLDKEIIRRTIRRHLDEAKECYERQLANNPELGGRIAVRFTVAATGDVVSSVLVSTTLNDPRVESCVVRAVRTWKFPEPEGGGIVIVTYPFSFSPEGGEEAIGPRAPSTAAPSAAELSPDIIARTIRGRMLEIKRCYERQLREGDGSGGRISLGFTVQKSGAVEAVRFTHNELRNASTASCILQVVRGIQFPENPSGPTEVDFPFVFQRSSGPAPSPGDY